MCATILRCGASDIPCPIVTHQTSATDHMSIKFFCIWLQKDGVDRVAGYSLRHGNICREHPFAFLHGNRVLRLHLEILDPAEESLVRRNGNAYNGSNGPRIHHALDLYRTLSYSIRIFATPPGTLTRYFPAKHAEDWHPFMDTGLGADEPPKSSIEPNSLPKAPLPFTWFEAPAYPPCGALSWYTGMEGGRASNTVENFTFC